MADLKLGMVGLDTSHCPAFTELLNDPGNRYHVPGARVTAAFPGGSREFSLSRDRVGGITARMRDDFGVPIVDSIEELAQRVDAVLIESVDGRQHRSQFERLAPFGKPVFIDKPLATSSGDARAIYRLSDEHRAPVFSASALRYAAGLPSAEPAGAVRGCFCYGPAAILEDFPGLFWYGIHAAEILYAMMGGGCREVVVNSDSLADTVVGTWEDGRTGVLFGHRIEGAGGFGCTVFHSGGVRSGAASADPPYYAQLLPRVVEFCRTGRPPVDQGETFEVIAFLEAAERARETGCPAVPERR